MCACVLVYVRLYIDDVCVCASVSAFAGVRVCLDVGVCVFERVCVYVCVFACVRALMCSCWRV